MVRLSILATTMSVPTKHVTNESPAEVNLYSKVRKHVEALITWLAAGKKQFEGQSQARSSVPAQRYKVSSAKRSGPSCRADPVYVRPLT